MEILDCVVVGAGIHGLCTAFWLRELGVTALAVVERFGPEHDRGSSHGSTRITRTAYGDPEFVQLARRAHTDGWPPLERRLGRPLRISTPGVFFGPRDGPWADYARAATSGATAVTPIDVGEARQRFPLLTFEDDDGVLVDSTAAVVLAAATMRGLREWLATNGVAMHWRSPVVDLRAGPGGVHVVTNGATFAARHVVLACGPRTGRLRGATVPATTVLRQTVGFFDLAAPDAACIPGAFPVWARIGRVATDFTYGLPSVDEQGLKAAVHRTTGAGEDPDAAPQLVPDRLLLQLAGERFACAMRALRRTETCLYTMLAGHRLHVLDDRELPVTTIAACSGHAFKFGPVIGRIAAERVLGA
jgi:glycine/D-amino acid oxidase-like deaminating enzyme